MTRPHILATDLDGTLIPLQEHPENLEALQTLRELFAGPNRTLIYASGRDCRLIGKAIRDIPLPLPDWIVADVGASIHRPGFKGFEPVEAYTEHLLKETGGMQSAQLEPFLGGIEGLRKQPAANQSELKLSFDCAPGDLATHVTTVQKILQENELPFACTGSLDPEGDTGLIDLLPAAASKHAALVWLAEFADLDLEAIVYAGDSGNDRAALTSGLRSILVGNAPENLAESIVRELTDRNSIDRLYRAKGPATSGVLEGLRHFGLI